MAEGQCDAASNGEAITEEGAAGEEASLIALASDGP
jgi:hypothetical protein